MKRSFDCNESIHNRLLSKKPAGVVKLMLILTALIILQLLSIETFSQTGSTASFQQQRITGTVNDISGKPIMGVTVSVKATTIGTVTDADGKFSLELPPGADTLTFSYIGMITQEVVIGDQTVFNIVLEESTQSLDEVVIVGYGVEKKVNLTGAVSSVKFAETTSSRQMVSVSSTLSGMMSGVNVRQNNGMPGYDVATIRIRGIGTLNNSNPLIIIDGMEGDLLFLNPRDIESISILKDAASASIYGSRAANGVILVTTRKGEGKKLNINYNVIFSIAQPSNLLYYISDYPTYMTLMNESARNIGSKEVFSAETISAWKRANQNPDSLNSNGVPNYVAFPNTDWIREMYHKNVVQDHNLSISGATQNARYLMSAEYFNNPGLVDNTTRDHYALRLNVEMDANKWLTIGTRTYGSFEDLALGNNYSNMLGYSPATTPGVYPVYNGKYGYPEAPEENSKANNLSAWLNRYSGSFNIFLVNSTLYSKVTFTKGLTWDLNFNYTKRLEDGNYHDNPKAVERVKFSTGEIKVQATVPGQLQTNSNIYNDNRYTLENILRYKATIASDHHLSMLMGYNETYFFKHSNSAWKKGLFDESAWVFDAATTMISTTGTASDWALRSWFGRLNYDYDNRYLFEANLRYDGSSRFQSDNRYGLFPSFSAGWRISQEKFLKNSKLIQNLKIRASWGKLGNNASGDYDYQALYNPVNYSLNGVQVTGLRQAKIPNPVLKWESTTIINAGLDASLLKNRLSVEFDAYNKITDGILTTPPVYLTMGLVTAPTVNSAGVSNKGIEFTLGWNDQTHQVKYSISGNFGYNINKVTKYKGKLIEEWQTYTPEGTKYFSNLGDVSSSTDGLTYICEGYAINEYYLKELYKGNGTYFNTDGTVNRNGGPKDGMIRTPEDMAWLNAMIAAGYQFYPDLTVAKNKIWYGDYIYADLNKDKIYGNDYDRRFTGTSAMPKITFGSQMNIAWKNFDLSLTWSGQAGFQLYWLESFGYNNSMTTYGYAIGKILENDHYYYNEADPNDSTNNITASYPRLKLSNDSQNTQASTRWLYNGSFLKLRNLTLGYTLPAKIARMIFTEQIRLYFSVENLFTVTSFPGLDPEIGGSTSYPIMRQFAFGISVTL